MAKRKPIPTFEAFDAKKVNEQNIVISDSVKKLSDEGLMSILKAHDHITVFADDTREELEQVLQLNLDDDLIDEIEVITVLSGE